jgi:hypothetical protein
MRKLVLYVVHKVLDSVCRIIELGAFNLTPGAPRRDDFEAYICKQVDG